MTEDTAVLPVDPLPKLRDVSRAAMERNDRGGKWSRATPEERDRLVEDHVAFNADLLTTAIDLDVDLAPLFAQIGQRREQSSDTDDFRAIADIPEPAGVDEYLIDGVLRPRSLLILAAPEGLGKSFVRLEMGLRLSAGTGALFGHYAITRPARTLVLNVENTEAEEYERERLTLDRLGLERADVSDYRRADVRDFYLSTGIGWLEECVTRHRPDVLVIDTGTSVVGDEWGTGFKSDMRLLRGLIDRHGVAIVVAVHLTKPPKEPGKSGLHGTSLAAVMGQWTRSADSVAIMADVGAGRAQWTMRKRVPHSSIVIAQDDGLWQYVSSVSERRPSTDDRVLRAIAAGADDAEAALVALGSGRGLSRRAFFYAIRRLRRDGYLAETMPYRLTDNGLEAVA